MAIYRRFRVQQKYVNGKPTEEYRLGAEIDSTDYNSLEECNRGSDCTELEYRWVDMESADDYICDGTNKYKKQRKQQKCITEEAWTNVYPYEYQKGELIEHDSVDCGYVSDKHYLYTSINGQGSIMVTPSKNEYSRQENVNILAFPSANYIFEKYEYGSTPAYGSTRLRPDLDLTMSNDWYVKANFVYGTASSGSLYYSYYNGTESWYYWSRSQLSNYDNDGKNASIIIDYGGVIKSISSSAFIGNDNLTKIVFPNCLYVDSWAFQNCQALTTVNLPNCISLYWMAFNNCWRLTSVNLSNCSFVGSFVFNRCSRLTLVNLPLCSYVEHAAFMECSKLPSIDLPNCLSVAVDAFESCKSLQFVNLPNCSIVGNGAFAVCPLLSSIVLPNCKYIGYSAFYGCSSLTSINSPLCSYVGDDAFNGCSMLSLINLSSCLSVGVSAFYGCEALTSVDLPLCSDVEDSAFAICYSLTSVNLPLCIGIGNNAFAACHSITSIDLPNCSYVGIEAFVNCRSLSSISLPKCTCVYSWAFRTCYSLTSIDLPLCSSVGKGAFGYCRNLSIVHLPKVAYIGSDAFISAPIETLYMDQITSVPSGYDPNIISSYIKSIIIPCSLLNDFLSNTIWSKYSSYFVCV